ncbi:granulin b isoform 2-T2 [Polymixia lowei]
MTLQLGILCVALLGLSTALICPDGGTCEDKNTCCKSIAGGYGCCPLPNAECCSDHLHCCFEGTVCDLLHAKCINKTVSLPWVKRLLAQPPMPLPQLKRGVKAVICPDQESECPDDTTCCQLPDGSWGCCPLAKAVCCEDKRHCCPAGTTCDLTHSKCLSATLESLPMLEKLPARKRTNKPVGVSSVTCPDGKSSCPDGTTCCLLIGGDYGCCPYPEAMCCSDYLHCCPSNTTCDLEHEMCKSGETEVPLVKKIPALPNDVDCPDRVSTCPDETTCCQMANGTYGCCPMPNAVCCSDHLHCCPSGTQCDLAHSTCVSPQGETTVATKIPAATTVPAQNTVHAVPCNDSVACAEGNTCCKSSQGEWACCPLPKAVCCEDHLHCCPHGTVCNLEASTCDDASGNAVVPWLNKVPVFSLLTDDVTCDKSTSCPGKSTCCKSSTGDWACCPLSKAICCDDHTHCCPHDTVCNLETETCDDPSDSAPSLPWVAKVSPLTAEGLDEKCDRQTMCPGGTTCCKQGSGQWACCPLPHAVCCNDQEHCCPKGYTCNLAQQTCDKPGGPALPWAQKLPARQRVPTQTVAIAPRPTMCDAHTSCPKDTTCCFMNKARKWGCCPLPKAVCCEDHEHCCPQGYTCNMQTGTCEKKADALIVQTLPLSKVVASEQRDAKDEEDVPCDGTGEFRCPKQDTCCKTSGTEWACCPSPKAVCCADSKHCCPAGYSCDLVAGGCIQQTQPTWDTFFSDRKRDFDPLGL